MEAVLDYRTALRARDAINDTAHGADAMAANPGYLTMLLQMSRAQRGVRLDGPPMPDEQKAILNAYGASGGQA